MLEEVIDPVGPILFDELRLVQVAELRDHVEDFAGRQARDVRLEADRETVNRVSRAARQ